MKKMICGALAAIALATALTGCGKFTCDLCGEETEGKKHTAEVYGEKYNYCEDCYEGLKDNGVIDGE